MTSYAKWPNAPKLVRLMDELGLPWDIEDIDPEEYGSSPGDLIWTGDKFIIEDIAPVWAVAHDVAHWLVHRVEEPGSLSKRNFGFDEAWGVRDREVGDRNCLLENLAAYTTVALLIHLRYPWRSIVWEMNLPMRSDGLSLFWRDRARLRRDDWRILKEESLKIATPYMRGLT